MANLHIAVFAKAPIAGEVKTRLISLLGAEGAAAAYRHMLLHALQIASDAAPGQLSLWTSGAADHPFLVECRTRFGASQYRQSDGDLGDRMATCLRQHLLQHERVLLIGSDCPVLSVTDLQRAAAALQDGAQMVFTPAEDSGYVLVGMRRSHDADADADTDAVNATCSTTHGGFCAFDDIAWSTADVMRQTREQLVAQGWRAGCEWVEMPTRWDVDEPADYRRAVQDGCLQNVDKPEQ